MATKDIFAEREQGFEEEYFLRKERELIEKMHQKLANEKLRQEMEEAIGIHDAEVIEALQELGYKPETVQLLHVVPLIQGAWASGDIDPKEREMIIEAARQRGVTPGSPADQQLNEWLTHQPPHEFFVNTLRAIRIFISALPAEQQTEVQSDLLSYCIRIAEASRGFLGFGKISNAERAALEEIATTLTIGREEIVNKVLGK
jgi:tellurite resistance protein